MHPLVRFSAVLLSIAFVVAALAVVMGHPWGTLGMRATVYQEALAQERIYERIPAIVGPNLFAVEKKSPPTAEPEAAAVEPEKKAPAAATPPLSLEDWSTLLGGVMPPDLLRTEVERGLDQVERYLHGQGTTPIATVSLLEVKRRLRRPEVTAGYVALLAKKPLCTPAQEEAAAGLPITCRPAADKMPAALENFRRLAEVFADQIPDEINLLKDARPHTVAAIRRIETVTRWSPILPAGLALLLAALAARSLRSLLLWWGVPLLIVSGIGVLLAGGGYSVAGKSVEYFAAASVGSGAPPPLVEALVRVLAAVARTLLESTVWTSVTLGAGGLVAVIAATSVRSLQPNAKMGHPPLPPPTTRGAVTPLAPRPTPVSPPLPARGIARPSVAASPAEAQREADLLALLSARPPRHVAEWILQATKEHEGPKSAVAVCVGMFLVGAGCWWFGYVDLSFSGLMLFLLTLAGALGTIHNLRARFRAERLLRHGSVRDAVVVAVERKVWQTDEENPTPPPPFARITLRSVVGGRETQHVIPSASLGCITFAEARRDSGEAVFVLCDPAWPQHVLLPETLL